MEGLSRDGETEESMSDCRPVSKEQEGEEEKQGKEENCEGIKSVGRKSPKEPPKVEKEEHERTHCPYRSWCEHSVRARARNGHHRSSTPVEPLEEIMVPRVHMNYVVCAEKTRKRLRIHC